MSVYNRKLFKNSRPAREKLNQTAGIMASSAPLMQEVQRFQVGGSVDPRLLADADRAARMERMAAAADPRARTLGIGGILNSPSFTAFARSPASLSNLLGPRGRELLGLTDAAQAEQPNDMTISEVLAGAQSMDDRFNQRIADAAAEVPPIQPGPAMPNVSGDPTNLDGSRTVPDPDAVGFTPLNPEVSPFDAFPVGGQSVVSPDGAVSSQPVTMPSAMTPIPERDRSIPDPDYDPTAASGVTGTATGIDADRSIPDPEAGVKDSGVRTGVVAEGEDPSLSQQTDPAGAAAKAAVETVEGMDPETATLAEGKGAADFVTNLIKDFQDNDDPDAAADTALSALGQIDPADAGKLSTDERLAKMKETISKFFGRNVEEEKRVDALNVAMLGFLIASGDSPNALQNIAKGSVQGIKNIKKTKQERMAREDKINGLVVSTVLGREDKESDQNFRRELLDVSNKHDLYKFSTSRVDRMKLAAADLNFKGYALDQSNALKLALKDKDIDMLNTRMQNDMNMLIKRLESNEEVAAAGVTSRAEIARLSRESAEGIASDRIASAENIAAAGNAAQFDRSVIANLPDGYSLAMLEAKNQGLEGEELIDYTVANGKKFAAEASLTGPDSLKRAVITMVPDIMKANQSTFAEASQELYNNPEFQRLYSDQMEKSGIKLVEVTNMAGKKLPGKFVPGSIFDANGVLIGRPPAKRGNKQPGYLIVKDDGTLDIVDPDGTLNR